MVQGVQRTEQHHLDFFQLWCVSSPLKHRQNAASKYPPKRRGSLYACDVENATLLHAASCWASDCYTTFGVDAGVGVAAVAILPKVACDLKQRVQRIFCKPARGEGLSLLNGNLQDDSPAMQNLACTYKEYVLLTSSCFLQRAPN